MRMGGRTDKTKLIVAFRNCAKEPKNISVRILYFCLLRTVKDLCVITYRLRIVIIIINIIVVVFMQGIYNYIPETKHGARVNGVAPIL
jgi:hypothetical protein